MAHSRRKFLAASSVAPLLGQAPAPANDRIRVGVIGAGGQGRGNMGVFQRFKEFEIAALCDVNQEQLARTLQRLESKPDTYGDYRRLLDRKDIDVVIIATPDHWHALQCIHACQAGKDVYVEKPLALTIREGRRMVEAARAAKRVVQVGTQQRSGRHFQRAVELIKDGKIGRVSFVRCWTHENNYPAGIGNPPDAEPPATLDWDSWLGPAPKVPWNPNRSSTNFRWFWDYAGGKITDWGTHLIDIVHWALDVDVIGGPRAVSAHGGKLLLQDNRETPDTMEVVYEYAGFFMTYSSRELNARPVENKNYGIQFFGTDGSLFIDRDGFEVNPETARVDQGEYFFRSNYRNVRGGDQYQHNVNHVRNFLECLKSRERPNSDIEIGHRSTAAAHLGNIAFRRNERLRWDPVREELLGASPEARAMLSRPYRPPWKLP